MKSRILFHKKLLHSQNNNQIIPRASTFLIKNISDFEYQKQSPFAVSNRLLFSHPLAEPRAMLSQNMRIMTSYQGDLAENPKEYKGEEEPEERIKQIISEQYSQFDVDSKYLDSSIYNKKLVEYKYCDQDSQMNSSQFQPSILNLQEKG